MTQPVLSLDIGGTKLSAAVMTPGGTRLAKKRDTSPARQGPDHLVRRLIEMAEEVLRIAVLDISRVGISVGGPVDPVAGIVDSPPNLRGWDRVPLRSLVADRLGIPPEGIFLENDANACALAEARFGAARGCRHAVFLTMSTGIGGGLILDGRLYRGAGLDAGEVGHQVVVREGPPCGCGNRGCLETVASGSGIAARLRADFDSLPPAIRKAARSRETISAKHLIDAARRGDDYATRFLRETASLLARGLANLVFILNPEKIILGTIAYHAGDLLLVPLRAEVKRLCWPRLTDALQIVATPLGPRLEELSGLAVVLEAENPDNRRAGCRYPATPS
ncbi:MAG: ROK family protein [Acidobacteriota bacterium]